MVASVIFTQEGNLVTLFISAERISDKRINFILMTDLGTPDGADTFFATHASISFQLQLLKYL